MKIGSKNVNLEVLKGKILISLPMVIGLTMWLPVILFGLKITVAKASFLDQKPVMQQAEDTKDLAIIQGNSVLAISSYDNPVTPIKSLNMMVTAYSSTVDQTDSTPFTTASGTCVKDGVVANNLLPFGAKVRIPALYGDKIFTVEDRMNARKSDYHVDIWFSDTNEAINFGAKLAMVEVIEY